MAIFVHLVRNAPRGTLPRLSAASGIPLAAGLALFIVAFAARALRLLVLLPAGGRIPFVRAFALSAGATFTLQVLPFRGGDPASWALFRRELGGSWAGSGAVFAIVKLLDAVAFAIVGLAGGALLAFRRGATLPATALAVSTTLLLALLIVSPGAGSLVLRWITARLAAGRASRTLLDIEASLASAHRSTLAWLLAIAGSLAFIAVYLAAMSIACRGMGLDPGAAAIALASLGSTLTSALLPSPAGTFGSMEVGFGAGLTAAGASPAAAVATAAALHILTTLSSGLAALPLLGPPSPPGAGEIIPSGGSANPEP